MNTWLPFEHKIYRELRAVPLSGRRLWLGFSGGADSTALLLLLKNLSGALDFELRAVHCHHGELVQSEFRQQSLEFTRDLCRRLGIPFESEKNENKDLKSEAELRDFRHKVLRSRIKTEKDLLCLAHHQDDLLETRVLRLLRGTGPQGIAAMSFYQDLVLRPFLRVSRSEIEEYLNAKNQNYLSDPSEDDLRSFLRKKWLPSLEERLPGATVSLARSLELLLASIEKCDSSYISVDGGISVYQYLALSKEQKSRILAQYISSLGMRNYTRGMIEEIIKCLDKSESVHSFRVAGLRWDIDAKNIRATPL